MNIGQYVVVDPDCVAIGVLERFRVRHRVLQTPHVLELLAREAAYDEGTVTSFIELARARAGLRHRNLVGVEDCGRTRDGRWFVVSDAIDGRTLAELVQARGALPHELVLEIVAQLANAIEAAYTRNVAPAGLALDRIALSSRAGNPHHPTLLELRTGILDPLDDGRALARLAWQLATGERGDGGDLPPGWPALLDGTRDLAPRALVLALAAATPADDGESRHGVEIVRVHARELLEVDNLTETVRAPARPRAASRYRRGERIGVGGMAEVFRGTTVGAEGFARPVAIKRVLPHLSDSTEFATMFIAEAKVASRLAHPNIVAVLDFDRDADDRLFIVMELVDGIALDALVATGPVPAAVARFIAIETLRGLGHAHASPEGVVHRDVTPHNILLGWEGAVKVADFGIAKVRAASERTSSLRGKPGYLSPEQAAGRAVDGRADLFAVGIVLWELLTGGRLIDGSVEESVAQVLFKELPRPRTLRPDIPECVEAVVMRLLERDPDDRYPTATEAIAALVACGTPGVDDRVEVARLLARRFTRADRRRRARSQTVTRVRPRPVAARRPRSSRLVLIVVLAVCAILGIGLGAIIGRG